MNITEYCLHYDQFHAEFFPSAGSDEKLEKMKDEIIEFMAACIYGTRQHRIDEAVDVMNTAIAYLRSEGITEPLWQGYLKLEKTAEKYRGENADSGN